MDPSHLSSAPLSIGDENGQKAYRAAAHEWLEKNIPLAWRPENVGYTAPNFDEQRDFERRLYADGKLAGWTWPQAYGGQGQTMIEHLIGNEEIGRFSPPESVNGAGKEMVGPILLAIGTEEQKKRFLPRILSMEDIWCQGFSEPEAGSDLAAIRTRATEKDDGWCVDGSKIWTSAAQNADYCLLLARTGDRAQKHGSLTLFAVPLTVNGVTVKPIRQINGLSNFYEIFFDDVRIPAEAVIGEVNLGWPAATKVLEIERALNRMYRAARFENELRHLISVCRHDPALEAQIRTAAVYEPLANFFVDLEVLRRLVRSTVTKLVSGEAIGAVGSMIKLHWSEAHQRFLEVAHSLLGHASSPMQPAVARAVARFDDLYLRGRAESIMAGASAVQLDVIANRILRLPRTG